jgi:hypothetical protein
MRLSKGEDAQRARPNYATLHYDVRERLDVTWTEYIYLDMVQKLSYHNWCYKSLESCAADLGMTKRGVSKMKERLLSRGLMKRNMRGHLKVTEKYTGVAVNSVPRLASAGVNSVPNSVNSVPSIGELSSTKNNNRNTIEKNSSNLVRRGEHSEAKERLRAMLKKKGILPA